jgi:subtilisin
MTDIVRVIIKYKNKQMTANAVEKLGGSIKDSFDSINAISADVPINKIGKIKVDPNVEYVEIDSEAHILGFPSEQDMITVSDEHGKFRSVLAGTQITPWGVQKIRAPEVHATGNKGQNIKVCIIDTGIDYNHPDLATNYKGGYNFLNKTTNPMDDNGHGTHCAGTIAALDNDIGVIGVAPEASIYSCKVLDSSGSGSYSNIISAIQWAINNKMQIISMSLGGTSSSQALQDICNAAYSNGILLVAAAGNSNGSGNVDTVGYPARYDSVVAVAATDSNDARASFSSCGPEVEVAAPGVSIPSTVPSGTCSYCDPSGYKSLSGTSMACPHTAGTAALVLKAHPEFTNIDVRNTINKTCIDLGNQGRDIFFGYGRIDAKAAVDNAPAIRYSCSGAPNYQCIQDPNGPYTSLAECQAACTAPGTRYRCTGTPNYQCVQDPSGPYNSLAECQAACQAPVIKYRCSGAPNYQCIEDPNGPYNSLAACQAACTPAPVPKIFRVNILGSSNRPIGVTVVKSALGDHTADEACKDSCEIIKKIK